jgi:hypothetical protein
MKNLSVKMSKLILFRIVTRVLVGNNAEVSEGRAASIISVEVDFWYVIIAHGISRTEVTPTTNQRDGLKPAICCYLIFQLLFRQ